MLACHTLVIRQNPSRTRFWHVDVAGLHLAASEGKMEAVEFLLKLKCNIAIKDRYGCARAASPAAYSQP